MDLEALPRARVGGKGDKRRIRTDGMSEIGSGQAWERDPRTFIDQHLISPSRSSVTKGIKSWNIYANRLEIWNWKYEVGVAGEIMLNPLKGLVVPRKVRENCCIKAAPADQERV